MDTIKADQIIETALRGANKQLGDILGGDVLALKAPMRQPVDEIVRTDVEYLSKRKTEDVALKGKPKAPNKLIVLLETTGGFIETVERIALAFRNNYKVVEFIVPNYAYSAGTVMVMSGDEIYMDYFSILGPIDPQYQDEGDFLPGMGYLAKFNELLKTINEDKDGDNTRAELALLLKKFNPAKIFDIEQAVEHSKALLEEWLPKYKFKNWSTKETSKAKVSPADKKRRALEVAEALGDAEHWHSHGRGITIRDLESDKIKLKVIDFGANEELNVAVRHYHGLFVDYIQAVHEVRRPLRQRTEEDRMKEKRDLRAIIEELERKAEKDERLARILEDIERASGRADESDDDARRSRARLPYSSEPPSFETHWKETLNA